MRDVSEIDASLAAHWAWLVPDDHTPLLLSLFGDWVFGAPDGSLWAISTLEGVYERIAQSSDEFNQLKQSREWLDTTFLASWQEIAQRQGIVPSAHDCITWRVPPVLGGDFDITNLPLMPQRVYQSSMSQLHRQRLRYVV